MNNNSVVWLLTVRDDMAQYDIGSAVFFTEEGAKEEAKKNLRPERSYRIEPFIVNESLKDRQKRLKEIRDLNWNLRKKVTELINAEVKRTFYT